MELRDYQQECVQKVVEAFHANPHGEELVVLPTASCKTIIFAHVIYALQVNTLIIAHTDELLNQAADKYRLVKPTAIIGKVGGGVHEYGGEVTVASIDTISRPNHLKQLKHFDYRLVVIDECFPAGTLVDGKPIEQIRAGDVVTAFDESTGTFTQKRVVRTFHNPVGAQLVKISNEHHSVVCTPKHSFYTSSGWKTAQELSQGEEILYVNNSSHLQVLQSDLSANSQMATRQLESREERILFSRMQQETQGYDRIPNPNSNQQKNCFAEDEEQQSNVERSIQTENASNFTSNGSCSPNTRWQRERPYTNTTNTSREIRMADRICSQNPSSQIQSSTYSNKLQDRYSQPYLHDSNRSRWSFSRFPQTQGTRSEENTISHWVRVDSIEIYKPGSDGTFGGLCPDGYVYNFEVEDCHTYIANGFVVHNCHHSAAPKYQRVLQALQGAFVLKVTATPDRLDGKPISNKPPLYQKDIIEMVLHTPAYLCTPRAIAIRTETNLDEIKLQGGDFNEEELERAINVPRRNKRVVDAYLEHAPGRLAICFAISVNHAEQLAYTFNDHGVQARVVSGKTSLPERKKLYQQFPEGNIRILCNAQVLIEGFDVPEVSCVIMARPTKSRALYVQAIGRGLRLAPGKKDCIILDLTDNVLKHRLQPQNPGRALAIDLQDGESIEEAVERKEKEEAEKHVRKLRDKRNADVTVNLLERMEWTCRDDGLYVMEIGPEKHRIALQPSKGSPGYYAVWARLAPFFQAQKWTGELLLADAQAFAEREVRKLLGDNGAMLVDRNAPWRNKPATEAQLATLDKFGIEYKENITCGEASDLLDEAFGRRATKKAKKKVEVGA